MFFWQKHRSTYGNLLLWLGFLYVALVCINLGLMVYLLTSKVNEIKEKRISLHAAGIHRVIQYRAENDNVDYSGEGTNNDNIIKAIVDSLDRNRTRLHACVKSRPVGGTWGTLGIWTAPEADARTKRTIEAICGESAPPQPRAPNRVQEAMSWFGKLWSNIRDTFGRFLGDGRTEEESGSGALSINYDIGGIRILEANFRKEVTGNFSGTISRQLLLVRVFDTDRPDIWKKAIIESGEGEHSATYNAQFRHYRDFVNTYFATFLFSATLLSLILAWVICREQKSFRQLLGRTSKRLKEATALVVDDGALETRIGKEEYPASIADEVQEINKLLEAVQKKEQKLRQEFEDQQAGLRKVYSKIMLQVAIIPMYMSHDESRGLRSIMQLAGEAVVDDWERKATRIARTASELEHGLKEVRRQLIRLSLGDVSSIGERVDVLATLEDQMDFAKMTATPGLIFDDTHVNSFSCTTRQFEYPRILRNLFDNAKKYGERRILVSARICQGEDKVEIVIENDGAALPPGQEEKDRLLEWGHRAGLHLKEEGNGIGLALAAMWLRESGGEIKLTDSEMEGGARVTIRLAIS